jgi:hypothetical protein
LDKGPRTLDELAQLFCVYTPTKGEKWWDALVEGRVVYGESQANTRHKVHLRTGRNVYVLCALDALIEGFFQNSEIESSCPHCKETITLTMTDRQIVSARPESTVLWFGISPKGAGPTKEMLCPFINFFASQDHVTEWQEQNPGQIGVSLDLQQAHHFVTRAMRSTNQGRQTNHSREM